MLVQTFPFFFHSIAEPGFKNKGTFELIHTQIGQVCAGIKGSDIIVLTGRIRDKMDVLWIIPNKNTVFGFQILDDKNAVAEQPLFNRTETLGKGYSFEMGQSTSIRPKIFIEHQLQFFTAP